MFDTLVQFARLARSRRHRIAGGGENDITAASPAETATRVTDRAGRACDDKSVAPAKYPEIIWSGGCCG